MWALHHCLSVTHTCVPRSWAEVGEVFAGLVVAFGLTVAGFLSLVCR